MISFRKFIYVTSIVLFSVFAANGQNTSSTIKIGYYNPSVTDGGLVLGYQWLRVVDESFSIGFSADWFNKTYTDQNLVNEFNDFGQGQLNELRAKTNIHLFPFQLSANAQFPVSGLSMTRHLKLFVSGGIGFDFLLTFYRDYVEPTKDNAHGVFDLSWQIGGGAIVPLGSRSDVMLELNYRSSEPSWEYDVTDVVNNKHRVFERSYDMSGIMLRAGVRFFY